MRTGLVVFGIVLLVFGAVFFYWPTASASATGTEISQTPTSTTVYGSATLPTQLSIAAMLAGILMIVLGLLIPNYDRHVYATTVHDPDDVVVEKRYHRRRAH